MIVLQSHGHNDKNLSLSENYTQGKTVSSISVLSYLSLFQHLCSIIQNFSILALRYKYNSYFLI